MNAQRITILAHDRGTWNPEPEPVFTDPSIRMIRWSGTLRNAITALDFLSPLSGLVVPLYEADVLPVGVISDAYEARGLSWEAASRTVDRFLLRRTLDCDLSPQHGVTPQWDYGEGWAQVCKARASCGGSGVVVFDDITDADAAAERAVLGAHDEISALEAAYSVLGHASIPHPEVRVVYERFVDGPQYEVSGVVAEPGDVEIWAPLKQRWVGGKILGYERSEGWDERLRAEAARAVANLGLSWCGFCVEVRQGKVIEVNARLGDDGLGYDALLRGDHPTRYHRMISFLRSRL
jgi:hypothetical protein